MKKNTPAKADQKAMPIKCTRLTRIERDGLVYPVAVFKGDAPQKGSKINLKMDNGSIYAGTVHEAVSEDGEVLCEFKDGLTPVSQK